MNRYNSIPKASEHKPSEVAAYQQEQYEAWKQESQGDEDAYVQALTKRLQHNSAHSRRALMMAEQVREARANLSENYSQEEYNQTVDSREDKLVELMESYYDQGKLTTSDIDFLTNYANGEYGSVFEDSAQEEEDNGDEVEEAADLEQGTVEEENEQQPPASQEEGEEIPKHGKELVVYDASAKSIVEQSPEESDNEKVADDPVKIVEIKEVSGGVDDAHSVDTKARIDQAIISGREKLSAWKDKAKRLGKKAVALASLFITTTADFVQSKVHEIHDENVENEEVNEPLQEMHEFKASETFTPLQIAVNHDQYHYEMRGYDSTESDSSRYCYDGLKFVMERSASPVAHIDSSVAETMSRAKKARWKNGDRIDDEEMNSIEALSPNQDSLVHMPENGCFAVFDGIGSQADSQEASALAADRLTKIANKWGGNEEIISSEDVVEQMLSVFSDIRTSLEGYSSSTTGVIARAFRDKESGQNVMCVAHLGDSRAYLLDIDGRVQQLTNDHGYRNIIHTSMDSNVEPDIALVPIHPGDTFSFVSDGITGDRDEQLLSDDEIAISMSRPDIKGAMYHMMATSRKSDDTTVVAVRYK